jgi:DNA-binding NtrC family response regulator
MKKVLDLVGKVKDTDATVLLLGETGVGKDHLARHIHYTSNRADKPFENVAAANFPAELWASEFFGHEKHAFTGAGDAKIGVLERAAGGTVYLNEISEVPPDFQLKMLHFLESREVTRLGGSRRIALDIRFIAASNKNLLEEIDAARFRRDLYYRLHQVPVEIPPLRERPGDLGELVRHFLTLYDYPPHKIRHLLDSPFYDLLRAAAWPGNVRQLEHLLRRLTILANGADPEAMLQIAREVLADEKLLPNPEHEKLLAILKANDWNQRKTARELGMPYTTFRRQMIRLGIPAPADD